MVTVERWTILTVALGVGRRSVVDQGRRKEGGARCVGHDRGRFAVQQGGEEVAGLYLEEKGVDVEDACSCPGGECAGE